MKSFICEAQTLEMAVRKAWENVGKPNVFFIKLVEKGNESIFWWKKKNFKIAFFYELKSNVFEINDSFEKDFKKNDKKIFNEKNLQNQKINTENKSPKETQRNEDFQKKDILNNKNNSFENNFEKNNFEKRNYPQKDSYQKNFENKVFDKKVFENKNFDQRVYQRNKNQDLKNEYFKNENFKTERNFEIREEKKNENFQKKNDNFENQKFSSDSKKGLIWNDRQIKFLKSFSINFYEKFFEKKEKIDFFIDNENVCKINFGKGPFEDAMKNKDLSLSIATVFSEVLYSKFRDFDIRNCKIIINFE